MPPRSPQERPKRRQDGPRKRQERPRSAPRAAQEATKRDQKGGSALGGPPGAILKRFGSDFGASGEAFWSHFGSHFRAYSCRILAAVVFLLLAVLGSVCLRARAGKPGEKPQERTRNESPR